MDASASTFPTADEIALAIVTAALLFEEDPIALAKGNASRARYVAFAALREVFEEATAAGLARCTGFRSPNSAAGNVNQARGLKWWVEDHVEEVIGALVADRYGEQGL